jgi:hypothetical protein
MSDLATQIEGLDTLRGTPTAPTTTLADQVGSLDQLRIPAKLEAPAAAGEQGLPWHERLLRGINDPFQATAQLLLHSPLGRASMAVNKALTSGGGLFPNAVSETIGGASSSLDTSIQKAEADYQARRGADAGIDWTRGVGNVLNPINWIAPEVGAPGLVANVARGAIGATLSTPATGTEFAKEKSTQALAGAVGGAVMTPVGNAIGRIISPKVNPQVRTLMDAGVTPTPGQIMGGAAQRVEDAATSIPFLGDFIKTAQGRGLSDFNTAAYQRALDPIGEKAPRIVGRDGVDAVATKLGDRYDALLPNLSFTPDAQFAQDFAGLKAMVAQLPPAQAAQFNNIVNTQLGKATSSGLMNGETLKTVTSELLRKARGYASDTSFDNRQLGDALQEMHSTINRTLQRANPGQAAELHAIDTGWANYARIRAAAASQGAHDGLFTPAQLSAAVKAQDKSVAHGNFAKGNALMQDLSDAGKAVLSQKVPDSGTPLRSLVGLAATGGLGYLANAHPLGAAATIGGATLGALPYTQVGQNAIAALLTKRPDMAPTVANAIKRGLPLLGGTTAAAFNQ